MNIKSSRFIQQTKKLTLLLMLLISYLFSLSAFAKKIEFVYPLENNQAGALPYQIMVVFDKEVIPNFDYKYKPPLVTAIRVYEEGVQLQEIEVESYNTDYDPRWPELTNLNFDDYLDLSLVVSRGSLGEFYEYWLYNSETKRFEDVIFEGVNPVNVEIDSEHKLLISSAFTRFAHQSNIYLHRWEGNKLVDAGGANGYFLPMKIKGEMLYCEVAVSYDDRMRGFIDHSLKVEQLPNGKLKLHGILPFEVVEDEYRYDVCIDDADQHDFLPDNAQVVIWAARDGQLEEKESIRVTHWVQSKNRNGKPIDEWCPVIPYIDLDKHRVSTFVLNYPSEETGLKLCETKNPTKANN